ncbi:asparagine synthase (glutamine-hydrolyzing), partial [Candidatus Roizmanbacteria bacterium]|nr:asparagine synthase (glutamine-hydrolyzing) [Candidatus Roizmanbacteria bacterium]
MCGLTGFLQKRIFSVEYIQTTLDKMAKSIAHRGPDDGGIWFDCEAGIGLAHRRLSVVDLSPAGHQPMVSGSGRYVIIFNGEIYNHLVLRKSLEITDSEHKWHGYSDTETLLACFDVWGVQATIEKTIGMFAFAVWDRFSRVLILGRDRLGEKPLYYGWQEDTFLFGSELKALRVHPAFKADVDRNALALLMQHNCIPSPYSIYQKIAKLQPGCLLTVSLSQRDPRVSQFWSGKQVVADGHVQPFAGSSSDAVMSLERLMRDAVRQQMMADVPLGAFLSGGVDSSTIVALMQAQSARPIKTFSIGFDEDAYNEAEHAKAVARHLGTEHTELYVSSQQAMDV